MAKSTDGYRKYISGSQQLEEVRIFCNALSKRIGEIPKEDRDLPLHAPLRYFGYGDAKHRGCNYIMNLVEETCRSLFKSKAYRVHDFVIHWCAEIENCIWAEVIFTTIGDGYTSHGGGFSHTWAGQNNPSAYGVSHHQWERAAAWTLKHTPVRQNLKLYLKQREEEARLADKLEAIQAELDDTNRTIAVLEQRINERFEPWARQRMQEMNRTTDLINRLMDIWEDLQ